MMGSPFLMILLLVFFSLVMAIVACCYKFDSQQEIIKKAFSFKKAKSIAISINSPGGSPVQSHLIHDYIRQLAK
ncbi:MAG: hypothetical protein QGF46_08325, partial [Planctomycetota bacterium]|nr:hypothetical protein [Planctomycetota bacterium]